MKSSDLRDNYAQKRYRNQSKSKNKKKQHVAHYFSLDTAVYLNNQFVHPTVPVETLKALCNLEDNFRMVDRKTNLSNHKIYDNNMMNRFSNIIIPKFEENQRYKYLLETNPSRLEFEMTQNEMSREVLKRNAISRAKAQAKRVQRLNFPNHYKAAARLFFRSFTDSKQGNIWDDQDNQPEFKKYLQEQQNKNMDDIDSECYNNDEEKELILNDDIESNLESKEDEMIGKDDKGKQLYKGKKGGIYYLTKSGKKSYVKSKVVKKNDRTESSPITNPSSPAIKANTIQVVIRDKIEIEKLKQEDGSSPSTSPKSVVADEIIGIDEKGRELFQGRKGGIYYLTESGKKSYVKSKVTDSEYNNNDDEKELTSDDIKCNVESTRDKMIDKDDKDRQLYKGKKGGIYYLTESVKKSYVKSKVLDKNENIKEVVIEDKKGDRDVLIRTDEKGRDIYKGSKGGLFYKTETGKKRYIKHDGYSSPSASPKTDKSIGSDDKGRELFQGRKDGIYYLTESGKKSYVKNK